MYLFYEIPRSGNSCLNLLDNAYHLREPLGFNEKIDFPFFHFSFLIFIPSANMKKFLGPLVLWSATLSTPVCDTELLTGSYIV